MMNHNRGQLPILALSLSLLVFTAGRSQTHPHASNATAAQGNSITGSPKIVRTQGTNVYTLLHCGMLDAAGDLWFGSTGEGLYRYDGTSFSHFTTKDGLNSNIVWAILQDNSGTIWIGTDSGLCRYDGKSISDVPISPTENGALAQPLYEENVRWANNAVMSIMQDRKGTLWFATRKGVYCYNGKSFSRFLNNYAIANRQAIHLENVQCMLEDKKGNIWFGSGPPAMEGICMYDGKSLTSFKPGDEGWFRTIIEGADGTLWLGSRHYGTCRYDGKTFTYFTEKKGIGNSRLVDKAGNIWFDGGEGQKAVEGNGGIWRYDRKSFANFGGKAGLGNYSVWCMVEDRRGNIWVGTRNNGLYRFDGNSFTNFSEN